MSQTKAELIKGLNINASAPATSLQIDASGNVNIDSNTLYVDATNNRVGIGSSAPGSLLEIKSSGASGNQARLTINDKFNNGATSFGVDFKRTYDTGGDDQDAGFIRISRNGGAANSGLIFGIGDQGGVTERARIDSSGRLLVGTSTAAFSSSYLTVKGGVSTSVGEVCIASTGTNIANGDDIGAIRFTNTDGGRAAQILATSDGTWGTNDYPGRLTFSVTQDGQASPTERQRIRNDGETYFFSNNYGLRVGLSIGAGTSRTIFQGRHSATDVTNGTDSFYVWSNGNVQNTNNSYSAISDIKLKENIVDANSQWDDIKALQVRNYNLKEGQTHTQIGLIAQEVEPISPGLVYEYPDRDAEGNDLGTVTKSVNYSVLYMKAVKALQEAMERIEQLEAKVAALESA